jgi:drug/metabolite transporter (DMT)-like permease
MAWRFTAAGLVWLLLFPAARRGWTWSCFRRALILGLLLWGGQTVQMLGLDRTSEAVNAFLTSLTVVFVPLMMALALRRPPPTAMWGAVGLAALGIWLMTGAAPTGFGSGELLGLSCALLFSVHMIALGDLGQRDSPWRLAAGQFLSVGLATAVSCLFVDGGLHTLAPSQQWTIITSALVWPNLWRLVLFATLGSFGLMFYFQPRLDPTRAALIYMAEPVFAALFAYLTVGRILSPVALLGAGLLLLVNLLVELWAWRLRRFQAG